MVVVPLGAVELEASKIRSEPAVAVLTVQPEAEPKLVGWEDSVEPVTVKPDGVVQVPLAVVQISAATDWTLVPVVGRVKLSA